MKPLDRSIPAAVQKKSWRIPGPDGEQKEVTEAEFNAFIEKLKADGNTVQNHDSDPPLPTS
jgi:hypothetical protein